MPVDESKNIDARVSGFAAQLLSVMADSGDAMDDLMRAGSAALGNPILITDRSWNLIAMSDGVVIRDDLDWNELMENGYLSPETVKSGIRENLADKIESCEAPFIYKGSGMKYPRMLLGLGPTGKRIATVSVVEYLKPFEKHDEDLLRLLSYAVASELRKHNVAQFARGRLHEDFIESLLDGRLRDPDIIKERTKLFNIGIHSNFYIFVFDVADYDPDKFSITYMRDTLERMISGGRALIYDNKIVIAASFKRARDVFKEELIALGAFLRKHSIRCGISRRCADMNDMRFHYEQAISAMRVGTRLDPERYIYPYGEYAVYHVAEALCADSGLKLYCHPALARLIDYDKEYGVEFTKSLYTYLASSRNLSKAADAINMHRNTLLYHIRRAGEIMEIDLSDYKTSQLIGLSFRLLEYEKVISMTPERGNIIEQEN